MQPQRIAAAVVLAPLTLAAGAGAAAGSCVPGGAKTLVAAGPARLYSQGSQLYGCLGARRTRLGALRGTVPFPATRVALYALGSRYAGIDKTLMGVDTFTSTLALIDLRTGAVTAMAAATTPPRRPQSFVTVASMAVDGKGTLAWIGQRSAIGVPAPTFEVHALTARHNRLLASGANIAPKSLQLHGETLTWHAGGQTKSAQL